MRIGWQCIIYPDPQMKVFNNSCVSRGRRRFKVIIFPGKRDARHVGEKK